MSDKRTIMIVVIAVVAFLVLITAMIGGFILVAVALSESGERVAVIYLYGTIEESESSFFYSGISPGYVRTQLGRAAENDSIKGVVLRVDSPGGSVAASQQIADMIRKFDKPVVISMGDMAASGGYYISAPAQGIVAHPGTMTGSIGVITQVMNLDGLYEMLGIEVETIKSGRHKDMFGRALTPEERDLLQAISDGAYAQFIAEIAEGRGMALEEVRELATGELFLGSQALELGLVDRLGGVDEAVEYLAELAGLQDPVRYEFPEPPLLTQLLRYSVKLPHMIEQMLAPSEWLMLDKIRQGSPPTIRYQVK